MKVGIDAFALGARGGGIETYVRNVIRSLGEIDRDGDYTLLLKQPLSPSAIPNTGHMHQAIVRSRYGPLRVPFSTSLTLLREHIDVVHIQEAAPLVFPSKMVVTLHDIAYERYPQYFPPDMVARARRTIPLTIRRAATVLTVSEYSRQDIIRRYATPPDKVVVAHGGPDPMMRPIHESKQLTAARERYAVGERFILYVGNLEPHKNLKTLIDAYVRLRRTDAVRHRLVLAGRAITPDNRIFAAARASGYADDLVFTGYVPDDDLVTLLNAADLFVFPSLYEGFGLPPLEAMACGTPVVTSNTAALPQVVGDAGLMIDPLDVEGLAAAIARVLNDAELRAQLSARGLQRVATFSWEKAARTIRAVYESAMQTS